MKKTSVMCLAALSAMAAVCCTHADMDDGRDETDHLSAVTHEMIVLGDRLEDPYTVDNMERALNSLYPTKGSRISLKETDLYVRFLPSGDAQYRTLESLGVKMIDHPLDYQIVQDGDYYHDPGVPQESITWQYAVVPAGFVFPEGIRYELLDKCYISENDVATKAEDVDWGAVEREAFRLTGNEECLVPRTRAMSSRPSGRISIVDESCNGGEPVGVAGVQVCVNSFVKIAVAYTDDEGYYEFDKSFSSDIRYRLVFKNRKGFGIGVNLLLVPSSISAMGKHAPDGVDLIVDKESDWKMFTRCVVNNAAHDYYACWAEDKSAVYAPPVDLRFWIFRNLPKSVSPMLQHGTAIDNGRLAKYLGEYKSLVKMFLPDVTLGLKGTSSYKDIYALTSRELAHCSHFMKAGTDYWDKYMAHLLKAFISSSGRNYGSQSDENAGYCAVAEMWAYFMEYVVLRERYGNGVSPEGLDYWFFPQVLLYLDERGMGADRIYDALRPDVTDVNRLKESLMDECPEFTSLIEQAFDRYGY